MTNNLQNGVPAKRIAAIDLGTNSFHAVLVDIYPDGSFRTIDKLKEMVILAEKGMENRLAEDAMERGLEALKRIKFLCDSKGVENILAFATSAIREATNGGEFIQRMIDEVGIKARAISGKFEAELIGIAVRHTISLTDEYVLIVDIGGGSVEFIVGNRNKFLYLTSQKLGVARMAAKFVEKDPISKKEVKNLEAHFEQELMELIKIVRKHKVKTIIGSSGTMENIAMMIAGSKIEGEILTLNELGIKASDFLDFYKGFIKLDKNQRAKEKGLEEKRVDIINPGIVLVKFLIQKLNIQTIKISEGALRDGMIINFINSEKKKQNLILVENFPEPRKRSIYELLRKCNWKEQHSKHVAGMALQIFDILKSELKLLDSDRELLEYASLLHDIGYYISHRRHHKHALYLIINSDLKGFKEDEIHIMAHVARYHRRSTPQKRHVLYRKLEKDVRKRIKKLSAILRVADGLDRSHYQNVKDLEIINKKNRLHLVITTQSDPQLEIWGAQRKSKLLEKVTGKKVEIFSVNEKVPVK